MFLLEIQILSIFYLLFRFPTQSVLRCLDLENDCLFDLLLPPTLAQSSPCSLDDKEEVPPLIC
nr:MAG TPA: hypothetical protein [Caudoviricetes sp.]